MRFMVEGKGPFPFDMLRYDHYWPDTSHAAGLLEDRQQRQIELSSNDAFVSIERWQSFGWLVYFKNHGGWYRADGGKLMGTPWKTMNLAPKDGTIVKLKIQDTKESVAENRTEDSHIWTTIGMNNYDNDGEDHWEWAGWHWEQDHFTRGRGGKVIAWAEFYE